MNEEPRHRGGKLMRSFPHISVPGILFALSAIGMMGIGSRAEAVVYVDSQATGIADGSSWTDAYTDLLVALSQTGTGEIWVAAGTYKPAGPGGDRSASFPLHGGVAIYGGFAGDETERDQRDPAANPTVLSGDLNGDDYGDSVNGHFVYRNAGDNSHHVVTASHTDASAVLDGFVIAHGYARRVGFEGPPVEGGGGLFIENGSPTIANTTFVGCSAYFGGAVYVSDGSPSFSDCELTQNYADIGWGGAVYSGGSSQPTFTRCTFRDNAAIGSSLDPDGSGGAIYNDFGSALSIKESAFLSNLTGYRTFTTGGTPTIAGAIMAGGDVTIERSIFLGNKSHNGGAIYAYNGATITSSLFSGNRSNAAPSTSSLPSGGYGGAMVLSGQSTLSGVTVGQNSAAENAGGIYVASGNLTVANSIVWGNTVTKTLLPGEDPIPVVKMQIHNGNGNVSILYSDVQALLETIPGEDPPDPANFPGSIDADPLFVDAIGADNVAGTGDDDLRLGQGSPAIDAGDNNLIPGGAVFDLEGNARRLDDPATPDRGAGAPPVVDMGAYEFLAAGAAVCGNGVTEQGEDCDDANLADGDCCSSACLFEPLGSTCSDANTCTSPDTCDGAGACTAGDCQVGQLCGMICGAELRCQSNGGECTCAVQ